MLDAFINPENQRRQVVEAYYELSSLEPCIAQLFAVIYEPISRASMVLCLNQAAIHDQAGKPFAQTTFKPVCDRLIKLGILVQQSGQGPQCHPLLVEIATRDAVHLKRFEEYVKVVHTKLAVP